MEGGKIVEFDHPCRLLENPDGYFTKMVLKMGHETLTNYKKITYETYISKQT